MCLVSLWQTGRTGMSVPLTRSYLVAAFLLYLSVGSSFQGESNCRQPVVPSFCRLVLLIASSSPFRFAHCLFLTTRIMMTPQTWDGQWYDFHGECDLSFLNNPTFDAETGMWIQGKFHVNRPNNSSSFCQNTSSYPHGTLSILGFDSL